MAHSRSDILILKSPRVLQLDVRCVLYLGINNAEGTETLSAGLCHEG